MTVFSRFVASGLVLGIAVGAALTVIALPDPGGFAVALLAATATVLALGGEARRRGSGLVFFRFALPFLAAVAGLSAVVGRPVMADLDLAVVILATAHAVGRSGCRAVGCCHGRPWVGGVVYRRSEVADGFPPHLLGVPLFPVQILEGAVEGLLAATCAALVLAGAPPGSAATTWAVGYALARLGLEELRGDEGRRQVGPMSEAQWTALGLVAAVVASALAGILPASDVHLALAAGGFGVWAVYLATAGPERRLLRPRHLHEMARVAAGGRVAHAAGGELSGEGGRPALVRTGDGVVFSWQPARSGARGFDMVAFSSPDAPLDLRAARRMARPLRALFGLPGGRLGRGDSGVFFLLANRTASPAPRSRRAH